VTWQQTLHFVRGASGTGIGFLCRQHGFELRVVDAGIDFEFPAGCGVIDRKVRRGTSNFLHGAAMMPDELHRCLAAGAEEVSAVHAAGCNVVSFGEMGAANTSASALWMHYLTGVPLAECIGAGSGLDDAGMRHKHDILRRACEAFARDGGVITQGGAAYGDASSAGGVADDGEAGVSVSQDCAASGGASVPNDGNGRSPSAHNVLTLGCAPALSSSAHTLAVMARFGGFEMAMAVGGMLRAAELGMVILVDGFIMTACMLAAARLHPEVLHYAIFAHEGDERGHRLLLSELGVRPLLSLSLRLGEGSGAVCAYPIVASAVNMINEMASFDDADVTKYF
jgi:nicotinate-nucleotide--dimethylbenzimidazole phosphoribosyltransferase